jgi:glycerate-2-kinase
MTKERAAQQHLDAQAYLAENRSYDFFASAGDALIMGDTGSNVSDLVVAMKE